MLCLFVCLIFGPGSPVPATPDDDFLGPISYTAPPTMVEEVRNRGSGDSMGYGTGQSLGSYSLPGDYWKQPFL